MAASAELVSLLTMGTDPQQVQGPAFTFDADITNSMNIGDLKPIIMTMANMANISEDIQVSTQTSDPYQSGSQDMDQEDTLRTHLLMSKPAPKRGKAALKREVYGDSGSGVTYEVVKGGTRRGADRLIDSLGFQYNLKHGRGNSMLKYWWCAVRNAKLRCPASVVQCGNVFMRGKRKHEHFVGQNSPKPHGDQNIKKTPQLKCASSSKVSNFTPVAPISKITGDGEYRIIKDGSKAGMDLLKDRFGYTFTQKKLCKDGLKRYWTCSVRNKHLRCPTMVIQVGNVFSEGSLDHKHMPGCKTPLGENDVIPKRGSLDGSTSYSFVEDIGDGEDGIENDDDDDDDDHDYTYGNDKSLTNGGKNSGRKNSEKLSGLSRERKKKEHPTFLGPNCTINLTKCDDPDCNCKMVHCPFCDTSHFIPTKAGRVQDHLELTHFAHGVQYDDLMIVRCFQDCCMERSFGHYHCVFCYQQILKRNAYARHMLRHMRKSVSWGIPDRMLVLPDSKFPDVINAYGFEIPICKKPACQTSNLKHYHCPQCQQVCKERSLTVNHLWRCIQRKTSDPASKESDDEEISQTIDESQLNLHFSHFKSFKDLPFEKCILPGCCNHQYHCRMCPTNIFFPTYRQHLSAHYVAHWKQRVQYKGYHLLKCFHYCEGIDRSLCKTKFHFHCPICCKIILTKGSFESHIPSCHMLKFGEHLGREALVEFENSEDGDITIVHQESGPITDHVDYMEDKLTSEAIAYEKEKRIEKFRGRIKKKIMTKPNQQFGTSMNQLVQSVIDEIGEALENHGIEGQESESGFKYNSDELQNANLSDDIYGMNILEDEIYDLGSVIFSDKFIKALKSASVVNSVLGKVSDITNTRFSQQGNRYLLSGRLEDLVTVKKLLIQAITGEDNSESNADSEKFAAEAKDINSPAKRRKVLQDDEPQALTKGKIGKTTKNNDKKEDKSAKSGQERSRKMDDTFPYSEIKEIKEASRKSDDIVTRSRGRPPKTLPVPVSKSKNSNNLENETPSTPRRYGTRGIKRNYLEMISGRVEIKKEPESDNDINDNINALDVDNNDDEEELSPKNRKQKGGRSRKIRQSSTDDDDDDDDDGNDKVEYLDDSEQEEFDQVSSENEQSNLDEEIAENTHEGSMTKNVIGVSRNKANKEQMITDSTIKSLKTSNVSTSIPIISKVGIRNQIVGKRQVASEEGKENAISTDLLKFAKSDVVDSMHCSLCDEYTADSFSTLTSHLKDFHHVYDPPRCDICEVDFDNMQAITHHTETKHWPKKLLMNFHCSYENCGEVFQSQNGLTAHVNSAHLGISDAENEKKHSCNTCDYTTNLMEDFCEHRKMEHGENITYNDCQETFNIFQTLKSHKEHMHSPLESISCKECGRVFSNAKFLKKHMDSHLLGLVCKICHQQLTSKATLKAHLETHIPEEVRSYRFMCSVCGKTFTLKSNYEDHLNKHTGNKPHKCNVCMKTFGFRSMLKKHKIIVHSSERPFKCGYCMMGFKFVNLLRNHITKHTNASKHACANCAKCFSTVSVLKFHMQKCSAVLGDQDMVFTDSSKSSKMLIDNDTNADNANNTVEVQQHQQQLIVAIDGSITAGSEQVIAEEQIEEDLPQQCISNETSEEVHALTTLGDTVQSEQLEVYACSECNATFIVFADAETHVLNAHAVGNS